MRIERVQVGEEGIPISEWEVVAFEGREVALSEGTRDSIDPTIRTYSTATRFGSTSALKVTGCMNSCGW
jgi:hypothetical protein